MREKTDRVIKDPSFEEIELTTLVKLLEQNFLMVSSELDLIEASLHWAKREAEHREMNPFDGAVLREVLGPAFHLLRFLTLVPSQFASGPALSNLLTREESFAILVNLNSPGSLEIPAGVCTSTELRCCPQNDSFVWDPQRHSTFLCQRQMLIQNNGIIESVLNFTVNKNIRILGIQIPSQVCKCDVVTDSDDFKTYDELVITSLIGLSKNLLAYIHFDQVTKYNTLLDIRFENSVEVKQNEQHTLRVWLHRQGSYPLCNLTTSTSYPGVDFTFVESDNDVISSILFTPASAADSKTFMFNSSAPKESPVRRKFNFPSRAARSVAPPASAAFVFPPSNP